MPSNTSATVYQRPATYASLVSLVNQNSSSPNQTTNDDLNGNRIVVHFPSMPEQLELTRTANYVNMLRDSIIAPDGFHFYMGH